MDYDCDDRCLCCGIECGQEYCSPECKKWGDEYDQTCHFRFLGEGNWECDKCEEKFFVDFPNMPGAFTHNCMRVFSLEDERKAEAMAGSL